MHLMTNYTMGSAYNRSRFDVNNEIVPANPFFKAYDNEVLVYEEREKNSSFFHIKRVLDIPDIVFNAILEQRRIYEKNRRRRPGQFQDEGYICCSSYGRPQSASYFYKEYKRLLSDNGLPNIRFHDLRHTYATILTNEEIDVKAISNSLGHSKTIITVDVYTDKKQMIVDVSEQTQEFACEIFPISYLQERQVEEANRTRFLKEIYYFPEQLAEEIMGIIQ